MWITQLALALFSSAYPAYASYKAIKTGDLPALEVWLMYWVVMGVVSVLENTVEWTVAWVPFYHELKALVVLWLTLPQIQGSTYIYVAHIEPFLASHEADIDRTLADARRRAKQAGLEWLNSAIQRVRQTLVGTLAPQLFSEVGAHEGTLPAQPIQHPPSLADPASSATSMLYSMAGNVLRQYGPAAVAAGSALLHPMNGRNDVLRNDASGSSSRSSEPRSNVVQSSRARRAQLEAELAALDSVSTVSTPSSYGPSSSSGSSPYQPRVLQPRSTSAGNVASLAPGPSTRSRGPSPSPSMGDLTALRDGRRDRSLGGYDQIGKDDLTDYPPNSAGPAELPTTPGGTRRASWWFWSKESEATTAETTTLLERRKKDA